MDAHHICIALPAGFSHPGIFEMKFEKKTSAVPPSVVSELAGWIQTQSSRTVLAGPANRCVVTALSDDPDRFQKSVPSMLSASYRPGLGVGKGEPPLPIDIYRPSDAWREMPGEC